jgi:hypothetical protein
MSLRKFSNHEPKTKISKDKMYNHLSQKPRNVPQMFRKRQKKKIVKDEENKIKTFKYTEIDKLKIC